ncbi:unnamed protein product, partial [Scytosiphon promiscuus]
MSAEDQREPCTGGSFAGSVLYRCDRCFASYQQKRQRDRCRCGRSTGSRGGAGAGSSPDTLQPSPAPADASAALGVEDSTRRTLDGTGRASSIAGQGPVDDAPIDDSPMEMGFSDGREGGESLRDPDSSDEDLESCGEEPDSGSEGGRLAAFLERVIT